MIPLLVAATLGAIIGWQGLLPNDWNKYTQVLGPAFLLIMIFALGAKLGANTEVQSHLAFLGFKALVISLATILGSVAVTSITIHLLLYRSFPSPDKEANLNSSISDFSQE